MGQLSTHLPAFAKHTWTLIALALIVTVIALLGSTGPPSLERSVIAALVNLTIVIGLYVFIGNSGVFSFGHLAFMGIGAYTAAILMVPVTSKEILYPEMFTLLRDAELAAVPATLVGGAVAALVAAVLAVPIVRLSGLTAALATFAVLIIFNSVAGSWVQVTNGSAGISSVPTTSTITEPLLWAIGVLALAFVFQHTRRCLRLRASREDEVAARAIGVRIGTERWISFCLSAFMMGIGGALFAQTQGTITPDSFYLSLTFFAIAMLVVGGIQSLSGAVIGVVLVSSFSELLRRIEGGLDVGGLTIQTPTGLTEVALALAMILVLILRPMGLMGNRELTWPFTALERPPRRAGEESGDIQSPPPSDSRQERIEERERRL